MKNILLKGKMGFKKKILMGIVFVMLASIGFAAVNTISIASNSTEIPVKQWERTYGGPANEWAASVIQTSDGGYIIAGSSESRSGTFCYDIWIVKTDSSGNKEWDKKFGKSDDNEHAYSIVQTSDGGYIIAGTAEHRIPWEKGLKGLFEKREEKIWIIKIDSSGNKEWDRKFDNGSASSIVQTSDGGYAIGGSRLIKTDSSGNEEWNRTYFGNSIIQVSDGYVVAGRSSLVKTDSLGNEVWNITYGGIESCIWETIQTSDGGYALAGLRELDNKSGEFWLMKIDSVGKEEWNKTYGSLKYEEARSVFQTSDGGYILAGVTGADAWLVKVDSQGNEEWSETYGGPDVDKAESVIQTSDGGYVFAGLKGSKDYRGGDIWLVKVGGSMEKQPSCKEKTISGFEIIFVFIGLLVVAYLLRRK